MHNTGVKPQLRKCCRKKGVSFLFQICERSQEGGREGPSYASVYKQGGSRKGKFYANVIIEWPLGIWDDSKEN